MTARFAVPDSSLRRMRRFACATGFMAAAGLSACGGSVDPNSNAATFNANSTTPVITGAVPASQTTATNTGTTSPFTTVTGSTSPFSTNTTSTGATPLTGTNTGTGNITGMTTGNTTTGSSGTSSVSVSPTPSNIDTVPSSGASTSSSTFGSTGTGAPSGMLQ